MYCSLEDCYSSTAQVLSWQCLSVTARRPGKGTRREITNKLGVQSIYYKQLKDFFRQREQKAFWVFNYANLAGLFIGLFARRFLAERLPWVPGILLIPLAMFAGLALTWQ